MYAPALLTIGAKKRAALGLDNSLDFRTTASEARVATAIIDAVMILVSPRIVQGIAVGAVRKG